MEITAITISSPTGDNEDAMKFEYSDGTIEYTNNQGPITRRIHPDGTEETIGAEITGKYAEAQENANWELTREMTETEYNEWEANQPKLS